MKRSIKAAFLLFFLASPALAQIDGGHSISDANVAIIRDGLTDVATPLATRRLKEAVLVEDIGTGVVCGWANAFLMGGEDRLQPFLGLLENGKFHLLVVGDTKGSGYIAIDTCRRFGVLLSHD